MQTDEDIGKVAAPVPVILCILSENLHAYRKALSWSVCKYRRLFFMELRYPIKSVNAMFILCVSYVLCLLYGDNLQLIFPKMFVSFMF